MPFCDLNLATVPDLQKVSVVKDFRDKNIQLLSGQGKDCTGDNKLAVKTPSSVSKVKTSLKDILELVCRTQPPAWAINHQINQRLRIDDADLCWPLQLHSTRIWTLNVCPNSMLNSSLPKSLHEYACILSLKHPPFCSLWRHSFRKYPWCSPYLKKFFLHKFVSYFLNVCILHSLGFQGGSVVKNLPANAGDTGSISGSGRFPGEGNGNPLQSSCLGNPMDRRAWWATVQEVTKSQTLLSD